MDAADLRNISELFHGGPRKFLENAIGYKAEFKTDRWTQVTFGKVIAFVTGIEYSNDHVGRIMHRLGLVPTKARP
jgi:transposase